MWKQSSVHLRIVSHSCSAILFVSPIQGAAELNQGGQAGLTRLEKLNAETYTSAAMRKVANMCRSIVAGLGKRQAVLFCGLVLLAELFGCTSQRQGELKGEVFIVTKGGENIKLGLVEIVVIPEAEMNAAIEKKKPVIDSTLTQLRSEAEKATAEYNPVHQAYEQANQNYERAQSEYIAAIGSGQFDQAYKRSQYWSDQRMKLFKEDLDKSSKKMMAESKAKGFPTAEFFFDGLPSGVSKTMTDSNGQFSLALPRKGRFALAAHAERQLPDESHEKYYWLVWVSLDGQPTKAIMLSNHNLMTSDSPDSVARAKSMAF